MKTRLNEQIAPEIIQAIVAQASASDLSVNDYLRHLLGISNGIHAPGSSVDEFVQAMESIAEDVPPLPRDFSREDIYFPED